MVVEVVVVAAAAAVVVVVVVVIQNSDDLDLQCFPAVMLPLTALQAVASPPSHHEDFDDSTGLTG